MQDKQKSHLSIRKIMLVKLDFSLFCEKIESKASHACEKMCIRGKEAKMSLMQSRLQQLCKGIPLSAWISMPRK